MTRTAKGVKKLSCSVCGCNLYKEVGPCSGVDLLEALEDAEASLRDAGKPAAADACRAAIEKAIG